MLVFLGVKLVSEGKIEQPLFTLGILHVAVPNGSGFAYSDRNSIPLWTRISSKKSRFATCTRSKTVEANFLVSIFDCFS